MFNRLSRRRLLEVGCVSTLGLSWPGLLRAKSVPVEARSSKFGQARSCVVIFLWGGPGQQDLWDPKPDAPAEQRGEFSPIQTNVPGVLLSSQLPNLSRHADQFTILRSVAHQDFEHGSAAYAALTGHPHPRPGTNTPARPEDFPTYGAAVSKLQPTRLAVPNAVVLGPVMHQGNRPPIAGQNAGFLGLGHEPFRVAGDPNAPEFDVSETAAPSDVSEERLGRRQQLLQTLDRYPYGGNAGTPMDGMSDLYQRAFGLLRSRRTQRAFEVHWPNPWATPAP